MQYAALGRLARYEMVSRFDEAGDRPKSERHACPGVEPEMIIRLGARDIEAGVIESAACYEVSLYARSGERVNRISKHSEDAEARCAGRSHRKGSLAPGKLIVDPVNPNSNRQLRDA